MKQIILFFVITFFSNPIFAQKYEIRAGWMASVNNIDWPEKPGTSVEEQKSYYIQYLDSLASVKANAVIMQVRPTADSFYPEGTEPWSKWLSGKQGVAPDPLYDPLNFMIKEAHKRGLEFHAWLNPYRIAQDNDTTKLHRSHKFFENKEMFVEYGKKLYFDPAHPESRKYSNKVVKELVSRYDIDAVHFDDYFYPYKVSVKDTLKSKTSDKKRDTIIIKNRVIDFPDSISYAKYGKADFKNVEDFRRNNVDVLIRELNQTIKSTKPWVKFGISPFGVWRNEKNDPEKGSKTTAGVQNYDDLYADILLWLEKGWIDYVTPQLYWKIGFKVVDYPIILDWWRNYTFGRHLYIGHNVWNGAEETKKQIDTLRQRGDVKGSFYWSSKVIAKNTDNMNRMLRDSINNYTAIVPIMEWLDTTAAPKPINLRAEKIANNAKISWDTKYSDNLMYYLIYRFDAKQIVDLNNPKAIIAKIYYDDDNHKTFWDQKLKSGKYTYVITSLSRNNVESQPEIVGVKI